MHAQDLAKIYRIKAKINRLMFTKTRDFQIKYEGQKLFMVFQLVLMVILGFHTGVF